MPPVVIGAGIAAAGAVGAAAISSKGASKAAAATAEGNAQSVALQREVYGENKAALAPWQQSGLQANSLLQDALGFNAGRQQTPTPQPNAQAQFQPNALAQFQGYNPDSTGGRIGIAGAVAGNDLFYNPRQLAGTGLGGGFGNPNVGMPQTTGVGAGAPGVGGQPQGQQPNARSAFDTFLDSINYNWQLEQGQNALNSGWAGRGTLQSGAAMQSFSDYNQNMARGAFQDWYGGVENMANRGFGAASAQAGVGQNYANSVSNLNSANANALANLQISKANNTAGLIGGLGQIGGYVAGSVLSPGGNSGGGSAAPGFGAILPSDAWRR